MESVAWGITEEEGTLCDTLSALRRTYADVQKTRRQITGAAERTRHRRGAEAGGQYEGGKQGARTECASTGGTGIERKVTGEPRGWQTVNKQRATRANLNTTGEARGSEVRGTTATGSDKKRGEAIVKTG